MKILVVGSGGREHALCWKLRQSPKIKELYCAPGNGGIAALASCVDIKADDIIALADFALAKGIDLTVVGPEVPLAAGIVDLFEEEGLKVFGPSMAAARLEGSKVFAKNFMKRWDIPTAGFAAFADAAAALGHLKTQTFPLVIKAAGLAGGKGVVIARDLAEAEAAVREIMIEGKFKAAGNSIVIEEFLEGEEASILAVADGKDFILLESAQDHKRVFDHDQGPNTGGMGAYSPAPVVSRELLLDVAARVFAPVMAGMQEEEAPFRGILYAGIMVTPDGPKVLEFNVRFGDPEAQALLPRLKTDLVDIMLASIEGRLAGLTLDWDPRACVCVVMAAQGYPGDHATGQLITGLDTVIADALVFHAATRREGAEVFASGGRVLGVTALGDDISQAIRHVYDQAQHIAFDGAHYRRDIGQRALNRS